MSIVERHFQGTATTSRAVRTELFALPALPTDGSFVLTGTIMARSQRSGLVTTFFPVNSGTIVRRSVSQSAGGPGASPCTTSPADGGAAQGFSPFGCSTASDGLGLTTPLDVRGRVAAMSVVGIEGTDITWTWDITLMLVMP